MHIIQFIDIKYAENMQICNKCITYIFLDNSASPDSFNITAGTVDADDCGNCVNCDGCGNCGDCDDGVNCGDCDDCDDCGNCDTANTFIVGTASGINSLLENNSAIFVVRASRSL